MPSDKQRPHLGKSEFLFIDCSYSGISGDLLVSSLGSIVGIDDLSHFFKKVLKLLGKSDSVEIELKNSESKGISGWHFDVSVKIDPGFKEIHFDNVSTHKDEASGKSPLGGRNPIKASHYSVSEIKDDLRKVLDSFDFTPQARDVAFDALSILIEAESGVHGIPVSDVHLHEIGSVDTLLDISGTIWCLQQLGVFGEDEPTNVEDVNDVPSESSGPMSSPKYPIICTPVAVGGGKVNIAHGIVPVPAPATREILKSYEIPFKMGPENKELATPTGVSLLAALKKNGFLIFENNIPFENIVMKSIGVGIGSLKLRSQSNALYTMHFSIESFKKEGGDTVPVYKSGMYVDNKTIRDSIENQMDDLGHLLDTLSLGHVHNVYLLETNIDDVRGEVLGYLIPKIMEMGALDVFIIQTITKKNRPGYLLSVICDYKDINRIIEFLIRNSGTLGVRIRSEVRICLDRKIVKRTVKINGHEYTIREKISYDKKNKIVNRKVEFEDLKRISEETGLPLREIELFISPQIDELNDDNDA